jgi:hypothetical protein
MGLESRDVITAQTDHETSPTFFPFLSFYSLSKMPRRHRYRYDSWDDRDDYYRWCRDQEEYEEYEERNNYYNNAEDDYYAQVEAEEKTQDEHVPLCQCDTCVPSLPTELPVSADGTELPADKQLIKRLLEMIGKTSMPTKLSYTEKLFQYLISIPTFVRSNERFHKVSVDKAKEFRADMKAQPIYEILDTFIAAFDN